MFRIRPVKKEDLEDLYDLSGLYTFINLPHDKELIESKINSSLRSFKQMSSDLSRDHYIFVLEDLEANRVIGCSMIHARHGDEHEPHFYLKVGQENKFSQTINTGFIHGTLKLGYDTDGPTEIGGLILDPSYRGNPNKLGKVLSFCRFMYMGLNPHRFKDTVHSELMPPFDADGKSPLWEAIGRRFLNMEYHDADILSRKNKEFILSLFPSGTIYETLLPIEARNAVGKVGLDTEPVKRMLESIGFKYTNEVDPFDGGPHYRCKLKDIKPVQTIQKAKIEQGSCNHPKLYLVMTNEENFEVICLKGELNNDILTVDNISQYKLDQGQDVTVMAI
ncbi:MULTISPECIES: arginine N-succinyltransferase [Halobacteriovorax]|uniref:Arginine N-succinyltransferase n=1 Tax=Halobacteriovorax vibrionivorans TaxID=2152716 RepID=A0ABY0IJ55_9BACT|nr:MULTISPECIES: arginine N-succinyltransferase [Halobacteriovorax]RZF22982.1 arginine N-succinyltransferase [Halobacteriovorax vibrionivorans]TGD46875.1 arginine N-succinyltransferase [Halobacteriovorax sp. Y22]